MAPYKKIDDHVVMMNGKTARDTELLIEVCGELNIPIIAITDKIKTDDKHIIQSNRIGENALTYKAMLHYMSKTSICVIPIVNTRGSTSLCGLTSFIDGCVMGQPILMSDNTNISVDIEKKNMGMIYKAGDKEDMIRKLLLLLSDPDSYKLMSKNCREYALKNDYHEYCVNLREIIGGKLHVDYCHEQ